MTRSVAVAEYISLITFASFAGCTSMRAGQAIDHAAGNAALVGQFVAYNADGTKKLSLAEVVSNAKSADAVFFGEEHNDATCNQIQSQVLGGLARSLRGTSLAMEFFETDTQKALNDFLNADPTAPTDEAAFRKAARQGRLYATSHRPMIELCRTAGIPVIAANTPRRLVREFRISGLDFAAFRRKQSAEDQALLPSRLERLSGRYWDDFVKVMTSHGDDASAASASQPSAEQLERLERAYLAQSLWDDSMAESVANARTREPGRSVMLVVGGFHVSFGGGTLAKFKSRRPDDRTLTILYRGQHTTPLAFDGDDRGVADIVIYGIQPPPEKKPEPQPESQPASQPASSPSSRSA